MHTFLHRYELDTSAPTSHEFWRDLSRRALLPAVGLWLVIVGAGLLIVGPLQNLPSEAGVNRWFEARRTETLNTVTAVLSGIGQTEFIIGACALAIGLLWWKTRQWWFALVPGLAVSLQALVFLTSALVVGRGRPEVQHLDDSPPTSSYPSGHTGAATAFYLTLAALCQRIGNPVLRWTLTVLCLLVPFCVGIGRMYRGMHSLTDVLLGFVNGVACAVLAWGYLRRDTSGSRSRATPVSAGRARR
ncbi:phosphatase PAP2 family protein [Cellulomonas fimi]|uniref:Phosphoesterase PA-phosphatase related protein n=1 Tax=Cellulomonas fimi (strain ATCC 484 / DSM 20113 / JCM 1341 / CCUG 24087 / LMG 16345 / NBRC 15513 / NCIMB 8980 / NCTC 7547 / NRS-133) TaxID=590998 RepID=F4H2F8_CELFA|nr:phosphatase PAP2 family protein [Cellulomonas fimi]AEE47578.1 phosphoesterase PA-phosphatase related protein [Cellulomonas fimi ATCC 484]NNH08810.1 phosphatase PAP2 family protein [Cellulomonas fimi]VEH36570.1 PAP2 (acid phosphatase) superfamily protein [Cellulomonas fimi]